MIPPEIPRAQIIRHIEFAGQLFRRSEERMRIRSETCAVGEFRIEGAADGDIEFDNRFHQDGAGESVRNAEE